MTTHITGSEEKEMAFIFGVVMLIVFVAAAIVETRDARRKTKQVEEYLNRAMRYKDAA